MSLCYINTPTEEDNKVQPWVGEGRGRGTDSPADGQIVAHRCPGRSALIKVLGGWWDRAACPGWPGVARANANATSAVIGDDITPGSSGWE